MLPDDMKKFARKLYMKCLLIFSSGLMIMLFTWNRKESFSQIAALAGMLLMVISFILFSVYFRLLQQVKAKLSGQVYRESYIEWHPFLKKYGGIIVSVFLITSLSLFGSMHENDFGGLKFVWVSALFGLITGLLIFFILRSNIPTWSSDKNKGWEICFYICVLTMILFVGYGPVINKSFAEKKLVCRFYKIESYSDKYVHIQTGDKRERFKPSASFLQSLSGKDTLIKLCINKGALGFDYVDSFSK